VGRLDVAGSTLHRGRDERPLKRRRIEAPAVRPEADFDGIIARMQAKPGMQDTSMECMPRAVARSVPGYQATYVYRMDADPDAYMIAVVFESREAYVANADSPEQDVAYRERRTMLQAPPQWYDGENMFPTV
jgi:heme-degrading monooxygenase HmoA